MLTEKKSKRVGFSVTVVTGSLILAGLYAILATPSTALAKKPPKPEPFESAHYCAWFSIDALNAFWSPEEFLIGGRISDPDYPRLLLNCNQSCLYERNGELYPSTLLAGADVVTGDPATCFSAEPYNGTIIISPDGKEVTMAFGAGSNSGGPLHYTLFMTVMAGSEVWDPLGMTPGETTTLALGYWMLKPSSGPAKRGCCAEGDFGYYDGHGVPTGSDLAITGRRFTEQEELDQDACQWTSTVPVIAKEENKWGDQGDES